MALGYRATPAAQAAGASVTKQAATASGDLIILFVCDIGESAKTIGCSGFTNQGSASGSDTVTLLTRVADGTEGATFTLTTTGTTSDLRSVIITITGGGTAGPASFYDSTGSASSIPVPSITIGQSGAWAVWVSRTAAESQTTPAGFTAQLTGNTSYLVADNETIGTGATGTVTSTCTAGSSVQGAMIAVYPPVALTAAAAQTITASRSVTVGGSWGIQAAATATVTSAATGRNAGAVQATQALSATATASGYIPPGWVAFGSWLGGGGAGSTTIALNNVAAGHLVIIEVINQTSQSTWPVYLNSANVSWTGIATAYGASNDMCSTIFFGFVQAPGPDTATVTWSYGTPTYMRYAGHEFGSSQGFWELTQITYLDNTSGVSTWPSLTPNAPGSLYWGFAYDGQAVAGTTPGFTWNANVDTFGDGACYYANAAGTVAPAWGDSYQYFGHMVMLLDPGNPQAAISQQQRGGRSWRRRFDKPQWPAPAGSAPPIFTAQAAQTLTATASAALTATRNATAAQTVTATATVTTPGTLLVSIAGAGGVDTYGNPFPSGIGLTGQATTTNMLTVNNAAGQTLSGIDASGNVQGQTLSANTDVVLGGQSLKALLSGLLTPNPWIPMTLLNSAAAGTAPNGVPAYQLSADGTKVNITGVVTGVKSATIFATLPSGFYNPTTQTQFMATVTTYPSAPASLAYGQCDTSGNLTISNAPGGGASSTVVLSGFIDMTVPLSGHVTTVSTFYAAQSWSYLGNGVQQNHNGSMSQGYNPNYAGNGSQYSYLDFSAADTLIPAGSTCNWATLRLYCQGAYYSTGADACIYQATTVNNSGTRTTVPADQWLIGDGQILTHTLAPSVVPNIYNSGYNYLVLAANPFGGGSSSYSAYFYGAGGSTTYAPKLTVSWTS